jgi:Tfp pilus assembly pilus retraction ATPase PilT
MLKLTLTPENKDPIEIDLDDLTPGKNKDFVVKGKISETQNLETLLENSKSRDLIANLSFDAAGTQKNLEHVRVHACRCDNEKKIALFIRAHEEYSTVDLALTPSLSENIYPDRYATDGELYSDIILHGDTPPASGLVAIFGATKSGKTEIAKWLCIKYLRLLTTQKAKDSAKPVSNFLMLGNPVETFNKNNSLTNIESELQDNLIAMIWRNKGIHYESLEQALLSDAKRQTPRLVYICEVQDNNEWKTIIEFAKSGHFVIATGHASNLRESMATILRSCDARTPQERSWAASALHSIVHCVQRDGKQFIALWKKDAASRLVKYGIGSVQPDGKRILSYTNCLTAIHAEALKPRNNTQGRFEDIKDNCKIEAQKIDQSQLIV